eukprot:TRINITY_DN7511_c0_g1_i2.p1 TRINITY_DN7511_c0_g1~~TRINITY_DN7511_c0_g1_i2.p1  ORF type:complete len:665 (-),score=99.08 TRINITY_DN7511_c0_g1_i2:1336-3291(-)
MCGRLFVLFCVCLIIGTGKCEVENGDPTQCHCADQSILEQKNADLTSKLSNAEEKEKKIKREVENLQSEVDRLTKRLDERVEQLKIADKEMIRYSDRIQMREGIINDLKQQIQDLNHTVGERDTMLADVQATKAGLISENQMLKQDIQNTKQQLKDLQESSQNSAEFEDIKSELQEKIKQQKRELKDAQNKIEVETAKFEREKQKVEEKSALLLEKTTDLNKLNKYIQARDEEVDEIIQAERNKSDQLQKQLDSLQEQHDVKHTGHEEERRQLLQDKQDIEYSSKKRQVELEEKVKELTTQKEAAAKKQMDEHRTLNEQLNQAAEQVHKYQQQIEQLDNRLKSLEGEVNRKDMVSKEYINQRDSLDEQLTQSRKRSLQLQRQVTAKDQELAEKVEAIQVLEQSVEELQKLASNSLIPSWVREKIQETLIDPVTPYVQQVANHPYTQKSVQYYNQQVHPQVVKYSQQGYELAKTTSQKIAYEYYPVAQEKVGKFGKQAYSQAIVYGTMVRNSPQVKKAQEAAKEAYGKGLEKFFATEAELHRYILTNMKSIPQLQPIATPEVAIMVVYAIICGATMVILVPFFALCCRSSGQKKQTNKSPNQKQQFVTTAQAHSKNTGKDEGPLADVTSKKTSSNGKKQAGAPSAKKQHQKK